jgi:phage terminase small subunit
MRGRKPNITALPGALDKPPPAPAWLPKFGKTEWARVVAHSQLLTGALEASECNQAILEMP